jgi:hypothetical protein
MRNLLSLLALTLLLLFACTGKEYITKDKTPPAKPHMIEHLGDLGDPSRLIDGQLYTADDENNGIDAYPDGDWFRISWDHLTDTDLDYIKIYRFDEFDSIPLPIDSISYNNDYYLDSSDSLITDRRYWYFIKVYDQSNNSAVSDTVGYKLLSKQILVAPGPGDFVDPSNITLEWQRSGTVSMFRVLVFDDSTRYIWHKDISVSFEENFFSQALPTNLFVGYNQESIYWRVDAFDWDSVLGIQIGSESNLRQLKLLSRKK